MEAILGVLKENFGVYVSGEVLAKGAGITRAGIWKQIEQLREIGYEIDSAPHKGYRLLRVTDALHPLELKPYLKNGPTQPPALFGQTIYYQEEVDSTNIWARTLAGNGAPEGTLVIAETQSRGKGRLGRTWSSAAGLGVWLSMILRPRISPADLAGITIVTAVAMAEAIHTVAGLQIQIKWPNDLWGGGRKLGGILAELRGEMERIDFVVVGIGVNVNHLRTDFPPELAEQATSLKILRGETVSRKELLGEFLGRFEAAYMAISKDGLAKVIDYARRHSLTLGKTVTINRGFGEKITGEAVDLAPDGSLLLKPAGGELVKINSGEIIETV